MYIYIFIHKRAIYAYTAINCNGRQYWPVIFRGKIKEAGNSCTNNFEYLSVIYAPAGIKTVERW